MTVTKDEKGISTLSSLEGINNKSPRKVHRLSERYVNGKFGAVPEISFEYIKNLFL